MWHHGVGTGEHGNDPWNYTVYHDNFTFYIHVIHLSRNLGVTIATCTVCSRKFAAQRSSESSALLCRKCRGSGGPPQASIHTMSLRTSGSGPAGAIPVLSSTPAKSSKQAAHAGRRTKLPPLTCKLCGVTFIYRRCLLRHVRETHSEVDINDIFR